MHICFVCSEYPPFPIGGVGARVSDLASGLVAAGHQVTVIGIYPSNRGITSEISETVNNVRVLRLPPSPAWMRWRPGILHARVELALRLRALHRQTPIDLIECTDGFGWLPFGAPRGVPLMIRLEGTVTTYNIQLGQPVDPFMRWLEAAHLKRGAFFSAVSKSALNDTRAHFSIPKRPVEVIYNAVDTRLFSPAPSTPVEKGLVAFANSIEPRKGAGELMEAMNHLLPRHPNARLVLAGSDSEGYSKAFLERVKPEYRHAIFLAGRLERNAGVVELLRRAEVCCYPSHAETFGLAPLEAMAVGKPVVYTQAGPGPELMEHGVSGMLCDPKSPADIAEKIHRIFTDSTFAAALGTAARQRALELFEKESWVARNIAWFAHCVQAFRR